jgi:HEAT repeat protein
VRRAHRINTDTPPRVRRIIIIANGSHTCGGGTAIQNAGVALKKEPKAEAAARLVRCLALAIKSAALYPASHPGRAATVDAFLREFRPYTEAYGSLSLQIGKQMLSVDGQPVDSHGNLANLLYTRKVAQITILPGADRAQIAALVSIAGMERDQLEAAGGMEHLLHEAGAWDIQATELLLRGGEEAEILDVGVFYNLVGRGRLSPEERDRVVDTLRSDPAQSAKLLQTVYSLAAELLHETDAQGQGRQVYEAIRSLDRIILDEPSEGQRPLYDHLAEAIHLLDTPAHRSVAPLLLSGAAQDAGVQVVLNHASSEHLAEMVLTTAAQETSTDHLTRIFRGLSLDRGKAGGVLSLLDGRLSAPRPHGGSLAETILPYLGPVDGPEAAGAETDFDESKIVISTEELAAYRNEAQSIGEADVALEAVRTLLDVLRNEVEQRELLDAADCLAGYLRGIVECGDFALLRESLEALKETSSPAATPRKTAVEGILKGIVDDVFLDRALDVLRARKDGPAQDVRACLTALSKQAIGPMVERLGTEQGLEKRELVSELLVQFAPQHVDEVGAFVTDQRPDVVRHIAHILGLIRQPSGVQYLTQLVRHADLRVRVEALDALARIRTDEAQTQICIFLEDPEPIVRLRALTSLDAQGMRLAMPSLVPLLEAPDLLNRRFVFRRAAITAVAQVKATEALPSLKKLAGAPVAFGRCRGELRRLARAAVAAIEQSADSRTVRGDGRSA